MLVPWRKSYDKPRQCIKKQRYHFVDKDPCSQSYSFSSSHVRLWELDHKEGWVPKNWCFQIVVLEKTLESPFNSKEIKPVNRRGNHPEYSQVGLLLKLKIQYFGYLIWRADSLEKTLILGKTEGRRRRERQRMRRLDGITDLMGVSLSKRWEMMKDREAWRAVIHGVSKCWTQLCDWTEVCCSVLKWCPTLCDPNGLHYTRFHSP